MTHITDDPVMKNKVHVPEVWSRRAKPAVAVLSCGGAADKSPHVHSTLCLVPSSEFILGKRGTWKRRQSASVRTPDPYYSLCAGQALLFQQCLRTPQSPSLFLSLPPRSHSHRDHAVHAECFMFSHAQKQAAHTVLLLGSKGRGFSLFSSRKTETLRGHIRKAGRGQLVQVLIHSMLHYVMLYIHVKHYIALHATDPNLTLSTTR